MTEKSLRPWNLIRRTELFSFPGRMRASVDHVRLPDGREIADYLHLEMPPYVVMAAFTLDGRMLCERHYKHGIGRVALTLPAGTLEKNENPADCARRELLEETGYAGDDCQQMFTSVMHANAGGPDGTAFLINSCHKIQEPDTKDLEEIWVELLTVDDVLGALDNGEMPLMSDRAVVLQALKEKGKLR
jgi:ADP-ribose pyrophosphatase